MEMEATYLARERTHEMRRPTNSSQPRRLEAESFTDALSQVLAEAARRGVTLHQLTAEYMKSALELTGGRKGEAAKVLGIDRKTLYRNDPTRR